MVISAEPLIYGAIFVAVLMLVQGIYLTVFGKSISLNSKVNRRLDMLDKGGRAFDAAADVLLSGGDADAIRDEVAQIDLQINEGERALRRALVVHGAVHGSTALPMGAPCPGTVLDLNGPRLLAVLETDANGDFSLPLDLPPVACNNFFLQALDSPTCTPTNLLPL